MTSLSGMGETRLHSMSASAPPSAAGGGGIPSGPSAALPMRSAGSVDRIAQCRDLLDVLVAAAAQADQDRPCVAPLTGVTQIARDGMRAIEGRNDSLEPGEAVQRIQCLAVGDAHVRRR